jgi:hypothetical protein
MEEKIIKLGKDERLKLKIYTEDGKYTGNDLIFDLEDIELPLKYQELAEKDKKNKEWLRNQFTIIKKKEDHKGNKLMSSNEEAEFKALESFFKKEEEIYNMFLGENGVKKLLNGKKLGWTSLENIDRLIEDQILPYLDINMENIENKIKKKYQEINNNTLEMPKMKDEK